MQDRTDPAAVDFGRPSSASTAPVLKAEGIPILDHKDLSASQKDELNLYFNDSVQPILSPLAVDIGHPFPFISSLALNLAITIHRPDLIQPLFIRLKVPTNRPRWVPVSEGRFVPWNRSWRHI